MNVFQYCLIRKKNQYGLRKTLKRNYNNIIIKKLQIVNLRFYREYPKRRKNEKLVNGKSSNVGQNQLKKVKHRFCINLLASPSARAARRAC